MADLSTQPYKGTRDFYPEDMRLQRYIFNVWRQVVERFGYQEYDAPMLELTDLYRAKTGEEIVNEQSYTFNDRGGREVTIRPEMTPSLARMVAARQQELAYPLRWYSIGNRWRYERPQRGRSREFWQIDVDLLGVDSIEGEVEIIRTAESIMRAFGATDEMFSIRINSRKLMSLLLGEHLKLDVEKSHRVSKLVDRKSKMTEQAFNAQVQSVLGSDTAKLMNLLSIGSIDELPATVIESGVVEELRTLIDKLGDHGIKNLEFDLTLMRGFDYYTAVVFEIFDQDPANKRSIFGGGRYDELTTIFDVPAVPAVGYGIGDVGMRNFLEAHKLIPSLASSTKVYAVVVGEYLQAAQRLATELRQQGINVAVDVTGRKVDAQLKVAIKNEIRYAIFVGKEEVGSGKYALKDLASTKEEKLSVAQIVKRLLK
ncbi:histidine--tRNA ligase [Candidatus Microgenomates bacterium]|nr:histidine--tRNA ligase [Candidatus Microgenomates bacterium]